MKSMCCGVSEHLLQTEAHQVLVRRDVRSHARGAAHVRIGYIALDQPANDSLSLVEMCIGICASCMVCHRKPPIVRCYRIDDQGIAIRAESIPKAPDRKPSTKRLKAECSSVQADVSLLAQAADDSPVLLAEGEHIYRFWECRSSTWSHE